MLSISTSNGAIEIPDAMLQSVIWHAERQAILTGEYLNACGVGPGTLDIPPNALLEMAAVLELGLWEILGLRDHLDVDLPTYREAQDEFAARCVKGPQEFEGDQGRRLSLQVLHVWIQNFAWDGPQMLGAEAVVNDFEDDEFIDLLAEFCWQHRHEISKLTTRDEGTDQ